VTNLFEELSPLPVEEFETLLERRFEFLRLDAERPPQPPTEADAARDIYGLFHGDLRGALRALDQAAHELAGYGDPAGAPMTATDIWSVLRPRYAVEMRQRVGDTNASALPERGIRC